jgi:hypothetical protein
MGSKNIDSIYENIKIMNEIRKCIVKVKDMHIYKPGNEYELQLRKKYKDHPYVQVFKF